MSVPARFEGTRFEVFALRADAAALSTVVNRYLVEPSGGAAAFEALSPYVFLYFADIASASSQNVQERAMGRLSYQEVGTLIPVYDRRRAQVSVFIPYIWVDSAHAMCAGREIFGYPKALGEIDFATHAHAGRCELRLRTLALASPGARSAAADPRLQRHELIHVSPPPADAGQVAAGSDIGDFVQRLVGALPAPAPGHADVSRLVSCLRAGAGLDALRELLCEWEPALAAVKTSPTRALGWFAFELLSRGRLPVVFLKQFRDAQAPDRACYQAIVRSTLRASAVHDAAVLPGGYSVRVHALEMPPLAAELGLTGSAPITPDVGFRLAFDFVQDTGVELWRADTTRAGIAQ